MAVTRTLETLFDLRKPAVKTNKVLVVGVSSKRSLGLAIGEHMYQNGWETVLTSRRPEKLSAKTPHHDIRFLDYPQSIDAIDDLTDLTGMVFCLAKTDIGASPEFKNIDPQFVRAKTDPNAEYCLPYAWGNVGIVYNKALAGDIKSWKDFFALGAEGKKITLLDDLRETIGIGLIMNGKSVNSTDPDEVTAAADYIVEHLDGVTAFTYDSVPQVISGDVAAAHWYVGANLFVSENPDTIGYIIPEEGATGWADTTMLHVDSEHPNCAYKWMEHQLSSNLQSDLSVWFGAVPSVPAACTDGRGMQNQEGCDANGLAQFDKIKFWKTPVANCESQGECVPYYRWVSDYIGVIGGR